MKLLHIDSSILGGYSATRQLSVAIVDRYRQKHPDLDVISLDLAANPLPHLDGEALSFLGKDLTEDAASNKDLVAGAKALSDFKEADILVLGVPMYNFGIPSQLKAWIDRIAIAGQTFRYGANGVEGLAGGKTVILAVARGGIYSEGTPQAAFEHQVTYLKAVLGFLGVTDVKVIEAEGLAVNGGNDRPRILAEAESVIAAL
ncbi:MULTISPECIES: FMN-dependent NADH-azoreductase [Gluconobacter]|uniref:FMN dependent NADH:quinone oxidoreductase n=1 Tax=Gluconobacter cerinus TaxID=38307 RepID=A0AAV5NFN6_9PROT|nr:MULTISPECIES: FMN-dependent NADH-azoreductase [Gluconobacter]GBQ99442.1 ACP phosphodiesterase [Gluconobacter cerinus NRIC 0229]GLQ63207.1 FMN-dependent NADH-azoreductase 2 [Gluconobacter cerinus]